MVDKVWSFLDGKKSVIGGVIVFVAGGLYAIKAIDQSTFDWLAGIGGVIATFGIGAKAQKMFGK
jgi:hypothetical protein